MINTMAKLVSIIIPVYNVDQYIDECLNSVINQTYKNLEIVIIDDGSTDESLQICRKYATRDGRVIVLHQDNAGVSAARNAGLDIITGEYVLFVDSDDRIEYNMVECLVQEIDKDTEIDAVFCGYEEFDDETGDVIHRFTSNQIKKVGRVEGVSELFKGYSTALWNKMFRCSIIDKCDIFDTKLKIGEDELWMIEVLKKSNNIMLIGTPLYHYRSRVGAVTKGRSFSEAMLTDYESQKKVLNSINEYNSQTLILYAQQRLYFVGQDVMKLAYYDGYFDIYRKINCEIEDVRKIWYANHTNKLGVIRRKVVEKMMKLRFPKGLIKVFDW